MKLYTEEQIKSIYRVGIIDGKCGADINNIDYLMFDGLTSIELPSDEEIKENADKYTIDNNTYYSFINGAKWMKEKYLTKTNNMKKTTTKTTYASYKSTNLNNYLIESGTCTLSQKFMPTYSNGTIEMNAHDFLPSTSIFATTIDGELTDVINIKDCFNRLPQEEKLKVVSVLLEFCAAETCNLINQNK